MDKINVECSQAIPTLYVSNIHASIEFYTKQLGFTLRFIWGEPSSYAGVTLGTAEIHLAQYPDTKGKSTVNFSVDNADLLYSLHKRNHVPVLVPIDDREYGIRDYSVSDPDGNQLGFGHPIFNQGPTIKIERVDVPVRLEKRLAALLTDLAAHKNMSISSCLEETLLHTFERFGDSVASPHTNATLDYIEELKKKHGIDYDTHASYRFEE
jgi:catechol 2,3-dioxygenase-like lactoylglutathione lyase family enzyme